MSPSSSGAKRQRVPNGGRVDIRTVAHLANVSIATVSRTINHVPTVNSKMAKRVWEVIKELNYLPNIQARALVSGRSRLLGLIVSEITNPFFPELIQGFEDVAVVQGYEILIGSTNYDPERMSACIRRMVERKAEGVAMMTFGIEAPLLGQLADRKVPMVFVDIGPDQPGISVLKVDYHHGIRQGVQHLAALGHRDIAFVTSFSRNGFEEVRTLLIGLKVTCPARWAKSADRMDAPFQPWNFRGISFEGRFTSDTEKLSAPLQAIYYAMKAETPPGSVQL